MTTALLALEDGSLFYGEAIGVPGEAVGEVVFNTAITGYQEILTDPSYSGQIIAFTFPHIGNVGTNLKDIEGNATIEQRPKMEGRQLVMVAGPGKGTAK